jgi:predicted transcriptional regulator of viral defense system
LEDELQEAYAEKDEASKPAKPANDGGMSSDEFARLVMPFIEGNGDVTLDDIEDYSRLDRKVIRHHLGVLVKEGRLERIGVGRHAVYSAL